MKSISMHKSRSLRVLLISVWGFFYCINSADTFPPQKSAETIFGRYSRSAALVIHLNNYGPNWPVPLASNQNPDKFQKVLVSRGFKVTAVKNPSGYDLRKSLVNFLNKYAGIPDSRILIYFNGICHNLVPQYGGDSMEYLVPADAPDPNKNMFTFRETALSLFHLDTYIRVARSRHILVVLVGCGEGTSLALDRKTGISDLSVKTMNTVRQFLLHKSAKTNVKPFEDRMSEALQGVADTNGDQIITAGELNAFLQEDAREKDQLVLGTLVPQGDFIPGEFLFPMHVPTDKRISGYENTLRKNDSPVLQRRDKPSTFFGWENNFPSAPFVELTPSELEQNINWPSDTETNASIDPTVKIQEETLYTEN